MGTSQNPQNFFKNTSTNPLFQKHHYAKSDVYEKHFDEKIVLYQNQLKFSGSASVYPAGRMIDCLRQSKLPQSIGSDFSTSFGIFEVTKILYRNFKCYSNLQKLNPNPLHSEKKLIYIGE